MIIRKIYIKGRRAIKNVGRAIVARALPITVINVVDELNTVNHKRQKGHY